MKPSMASKRVVDKFDSSPSGASLGFSFLLCFKPAGTKENLHYTTFQVDENNKFISSFFSRTEVNSQKVRRESKHRSFVHPFCGHCHNWH